MQTRGVSTTKNKGSILHRNWHLSCRLIIHNRGRLLGGIGIYLSEVAFPMCENQYIEQLFFLTNDPI
jgi:hypothetical protein